MRRTLSRTTRSMARPPAAAARTAPRARALCSPSPTAGRRLGDSNDCNNATPLSCDDMTWGCDGSCNEHWARRRGAGYFQRGCDKSCNHVCSCDDNNVGGFSPTHGGISSLPQVGSAQTLGAVAMWCGKVSTRGFAQFRAIFRAHQASASHR